MKLMIQKFVDWSAWYALCIAYVGNFDNVKGLISFTIGLVAGLYLILHNRQKWINERKKADGKD